MIEESRGGGLGRKGAARGGVRAFGAKGEISREGIAAVIRRKQAAGATLAVRNRAVSVSNTAAFLSLGVRRRKCPTSSRPPRMRDNRDLDSPDSYRLPALIYIDG